MITLVDVSAEFWRAYFATRSDVDAYQITLERIQYYRDNCERTAVLCDGSNCIRYSYFPEYKAQRDPKPQDALDSLRSVKEQVASWGMPIIECEGYECDDLMATLVRQAWPEDVQLVVQDKDLYQLISETCWLVGKRGLVREAECIEKFGVRPDQMRDWLALVGDAADNIPGCPNTGPGRARDLLKRFGTIEGIRAATDEEIREVRGIGKKTLDSLRSWDPTLAVKLTTLLDDAPVKLEQIWPLVA